jgi:hypothetical protein
MLINWTLAKSLPVKAFPKSAVLLGSIAPDIPLYFLSIGGAMWFTWIENMKPGQVAQHMFKNLFYNDPVWMSLHNVLHSPTVLIAALTLLWFTEASEKLVASWWTWFFGSCLLHTLVDIPVHHDDGPLVFWPLNWSFRYASPLSYWDMNHYAAFVIPFEVTLAIVLTLILIRNWFKRAKPEHKGVSTD